MNETRVAALYVHGMRSSRPEDSEPTPMLAMPRVEVVEGMGVRQDPRYFRKADPGRQRPRQVSLIDEGTIRRHEARFGQIQHNFIKAQIILEGDVHLPDLLDATLLLGEDAALTISKEREPCYAMDLIAPGLREAMIGGEQGALARVTRSGVIAVGDRVVIQPVTAALSQPAQ